MSLTMDGVGRKSVIDFSPRPQILNLNTKPKLLPQRSYVTGLDGIRRPVAQIAATPVRRLLESIQTVEDESNLISKDEQVNSGTTSVVALSPMPSFAAEPFRKYGRTVSLSLVAAAIVGAGGVGAWQSISNISNATGAKTVSKTAATSSVLKAPTSNVNAGAVAGASTQEAASLQTLLDQFDADHAGIYSLYVKDLKNGTTAQLNADESETSASLYKLFVAQQIVREVDAGQITYSESAGAGTGRNIEDCMTVMINISDNACGRALGDMLGWGAQDGALITDGYPNTSLVSPQKTSARDVGRLFERLYSGTLASANSSQRMLGLLKDQRVNNRIPTGVPVDTIVAHKTGDLYGYMHDAGIVYGAKTDYVVVALGKPGAKAADFTELSTKLWNFFESQPVSAK